LAHSPLLAAGAGVVIGASVPIGVSVVGIESVPPVALLGPGAGVGVGVGYEHAERHRSIRKRPIFPTENFLFNLISPS
jgi:hypothetical protein